MRRATGEIADTPQLSRPRGRAFEQQQMSAKGKQSLGKPRSIEARAKQSAARRKVKVTLPTLSWDKE